MNIQNISGPDVVTTGMSVNSEVSTRSTQPEENNTKSTPRASEDNKGHNIDAYA